MVDAGANDLLKVGPTGRISTVAVFPAQIVPAPDLDPPPSPSSTPYPRRWSVDPIGDLYVSQLTGFPFIPTAANIYRVDQRGGEPEVYASGFTNVTDLAFAP